MVLLRTASAKTQSVQTEKAFENSAVNVFILDGDKVNGCGRALSDGISQAAIYNIVVDEAYHHQGLLQDHRLDPGGDGEL